MQRKWGADGPNQAKKGGFGIANKTNDFSAQRKDKETAADIENSLGAWSSAVDIAIKFDWVNTQDSLDASMGFERFAEGPPRLGWMVNMVETIARTPECATGHAAIDCYFLEEDGASFKVTILYEPYFYLVCKPGTEPDVEDFIRRSFQGLISSIATMQKEDLKLPNHLSGKLQTVIKLSFYNMQNLLSVRKSIFPIVTANKGKMSAESTYEGMNDLEGGESERKVAKKAHVREAADYIADIREYDVMYYVRAAIDCDFRVGLWYEVKASGLGRISIEERKDKVKRAEPVVLAFDIETTKLPLKFPDAAIDSIMMISYMIDGQGFLITNRALVSCDIEDFDYTPKPEYEGPFTIFNEADEKAVLVRFFDHIRQSKPTVFVTYNGDFFDWPFIDARAKQHGMTLKKEIGFCKDSQDEYKASHAIHMDAFCWVKRDSYLPQGSQGLKAVTTYKLGYNPLELDPEDMTRFAAEQPQTLAQYSVSDAVATYYLYMKYVHPFIFSLCNIIPMNPDDVLRRGSGTLCETLLMVESYKANVLMPNKHQDQTGKLFEGHLLESETYVGGHVEALEAGVFRSDLETQFKLVPSAYQQLIDEIDQALEFSIKVEHQLNIEDVVNYEEIRASIVENLTELRDEPNRMRLPLIYHLDVAAMYPNIILTNRLQPDAIVTENDCAACDFNEGPDSSCQRRMIWSWRGEYFPAKRSEYNMIRNQLEREMFPTTYANGGAGPSKSFHDLRLSEQDAHIKKRVEEYSKKIYARKLVNKVIDKESIVCQRENPFYVDTVRNFRDRRYTYKGLLKTWKKKVDDAVSDGDLAAVSEAKKMTVVYDSLQLAHKCILNSFYGYVMRKGARWYSMEMAGIVCLTGSTIIQLARSRVEQLGRPLELDTDGIWLILPKGFPENFVFKLKNGKSAYISYPCVMLNHLVHAEFTNHQYQDLKDPHAAIREYVVKSENSIFFEVDGPYKAMILPSSTEEDKLLKKRYAVFNDDGSLAELKGFEVKRRGELKLIKIFQTALFKVFLEGTTLDECYTAVAGIANQWLDVLYSKGADVPDDELFDLISENRSMSKSLEDYGSQKSTSISTAKRLAEFLGDAMVKDKGLACKFIISQKPVGLPVSERAIPVSIFQAEDSIKKHYLRKWLKDSSLLDIDIRQILDWQYYLERFGSVIQKLITIPAAMQGVSNPVPRIRHPDWLQKRVAVMEDRFKQRKITDMFSKHAGTAYGDFSVPLDIEIDEDGVGNHAAAAEGVKDKDMEDVIPDGDRGTLKPNGIVQPTFHKNVRKRGRVAVQDPTDDDIVIPAILPDPTENYSAWLKYQKIKWRRMHADRGWDGSVGVASSKSNGGMTRRLGRAAMSNTESFFVQQTKSILRLPWQILQIVATDTGGEFFVWALIGDSMYKVKLQVPRVFYINSRVPMPEDVDVNRNGYRMEKRQKTLPRSHVCLNLYELYMTEAFYHEHSDVFAKMFCHHDVEGVYETQIPLLFRALMNLGCSATVASSRVHSGRDLNAGFELNDLQHMSFSKVPYLKDSNLKILYLYHAGRGSRHIYGLFSSAGDKVAVFYVDPARNRAAVPNLGRVYLERRGDRSGDADGEAGTQYQSSSSQTQSTQRTPGESAGIAFEYTETMATSFTVHETDADAISAVNAAIFEYQNARRGPTMVVLQSSKTSRQLQTSGLSHLNDFPIICIQSHKNDNLFQALGWQTQASTRMMSHFLNINSFLNERVELSRYSDIPIGNIENDYPLFLADVFFARRLHKSDMVLWFSPSDKPDLGGREQDDHQLELEDLVNPEINHPGTYTNVCVEIDMFNLAFNTVLQSSYVNEIEGSSEVDGIATGSNFVDDQFKTANNEQLKSEEHQLTTSSLNTSDEKHVNARTFRIMREMVQAWQYQFESRHDRLAEMMLEHLYRWLTSSASRMHDPALYNMIHRLMRKVFLQFVGEFKQLGSQLVYCSFEKLVLSTCKTSLKQAIHYAKYVIETICKRPLFLHIDVAVTQFWDHLIWMDRHNYGGVACQNPQDVIENRQVSETVDGETMTIEMRWNIMDYLPPVLHSEFEQIIGHFIYEVHRNKATRRAKRLKEGTAAPEDAGVEAAEAVTASTPIDMAVFLRELIGKHLKRKMLAYVETIDRRVHSNSPSDHQFPDLPGSHLEFKNPALEFVKTLLAILELDKTIERDTRVLKRDLLNVLGIKEFAQEAVFVNPCEPFRLPQIICEYCNLTRDMDLTRDRDLLPIQRIVEENEDEEERADGAAAYVSDEDDSNDDADEDDDMDPHQDDEEAKKSPRNKKTKGAGGGSTSRMEVSAREWLCSACGTEYDRTSIEQKLIDLVSKRLMLWQLQDLKCKLCKNIRARNVDLQCECSGAYTTTLSRGEFIRKLKVFGNIARFYQMEMLAEVVRWVSGMV
ncbi:hypothetical protein BJ741DRAFT_603225 [Chytriomyces cf. hyalinus JEL632]|nr:hypothetical protein BJ741DRAFT_603225 [Chytriomyces cf. hyalinus JEL632]